AEDAEDGILTLEPLIEAVREGVEKSGWELSGLQKTTSHQFEGRWEGESTRSAYLFFHSPTAPEQVSVDVYLDETSRGLTGNLALVVDLVDLDDLGDPTEVLRELGRLSRRTFPEGYATPLTLRLRLKDGSEEPGAAESEVRFKLRLPRAVIAEGPGAIRGLAGTAMSAFRGILGSVELQRLIPQE
ncbi:MAG: hypothetical protein PVF19_09725, partial [Gemmatimonadota bacterium]